MPCAVGGPPNLLTDGDFEDGSPPSGWNLNDGSGNSSGLSSADAPVLSGAHSAQISGSSSSYTLQASSSISASTNMTYCFKGFVRAPSANSLQVSPALAVLLTGGYAVGPSITPTDSWSEFSASLTPTGDGPLLIQVSIDASAGPVLVYLDDLWLWISADGSCSEH